MKKETNRAKTPLSGKTLAVPPDDVPPMSVLALVGLSFAVVSMFLWICAFMGVFFGAFALFQMKRQQRRGRGWAVFAIVLSLVVLALNIGRLWLA